MEDRILGIIRRFASTDFYPEGAIPSAKLNNAIGNYPVPGNERVLALLDATVFGSAKNGMVIGRNGVYWKNDWATDSVKNSLSWDEISQNRSYIKEKGFDLILAPGCVVGLSGCSVKPKELKDMLCDIVGAIYSEDSGDAGKQRSTSEFEVPHGDSQAAAHSAAGADNHAGATNHSSEGAGASARRAPFPGSYDRDLVDLTRAVAGRHRLASSIHVAPQIPVYKVQKILDICGGNIDPYSIMVVVDNTLLATAKDFLIITDRQIIAKGMLRNVDTFNLQDIRSLRVAEKRLLINDYDFQFLDQFSESETVVLANFLHELIPALLSRPRSASGGTSDSSIDPKISAVLFEALGNALNQLRLQMEGCPADEFESDVVPLVAIMFGFFEVVGAHAAKLDWDESSCALHQYLFAYSFVTAYAFQKNPARYGNEGFAGFYSVCAHTVINSVFKVGKQYGADFRSGVSAYQTLFDLAFSLSNPGVDFGALTNRLTNVKPEDQEAIVVAKMSAESAVDLLDDALASLDE